MHLTFSKCFGKIEEKFITNLNFLNFQCKIWNNLYHAGQERYYFGSGWSAGFKFPKMRLIYK